MQRIFQLAQVHAKICQDLKVLFIDNLQDIHNVISDESQTLLHGFHGMACEMSKGMVPLFHSIHNTAKKTTKAILVYDWELCSGG